MSTATAYEYQPSASLDKVEKTRPEFANLAWKQARDIRDYKLREEIANHICDNDLWPDWRWRRYMACGCVFEYVSPVCGTVRRVPYYCRLYRICPTCARIRSRRMAAEIKGLIPKIEKASEKRLQATKNAVLDVLEQLTTLSKLGGGGAVEYGQIGPLKAHLDAEIGRQIDAIRSIQGIRPGRALKALRQAKRGLRDQGLNRRSWVQLLLAAQRVLADAIDYRWRLITVTIRTNGRYWWAVQQAAAGFPKVYRRLFKAPGTAAYRCIEFAPETGNVHIHCLYYGPYVPQRLLSEAWLKETGSYVVDIRAVKQDEQDLDGAIDEVTKYMTKLAAVSPAQLVEFEKALYKRQMSQRYGLFRELNKPKAQRPPVPAIAARLPRYPGDQGGGWRVEFERPITCPCGCGGRMQLVADQQPYHPAFSRAQQELFSPGPAKTDLIKPAIGGVAPGVFRPKPPGVGGDARSA